MSNKHNGCSGVGLCCQCMNYNSVGTFKVLSMGDMRAIGHEEEAGYTGVSRTVSHYKG